MYTKYGTKLVDRSRYSLECYGTKLVSRYLLDRLVHTRRAFMSQAVDDIRPNAAGQ